MRPSLPPDVLSDLEIVDLTFGSKSWDRRKLHQSRDWAIACLEHAATHLIEDQMRPDRIYVPGAKAALDMIREAIVKIKVDTELRERAGRVAASWLPKYTLARQSRNGASDA